MEDKSEIHETEPYVYSQTITGRASGDPGHAKNSWLTGTASWTFLSVSQYILGIMPDYNGLIVNPCIPDDWKEFTVQRKFRGTEYIIHVTRTGRYSLWSDGVRVEGRTLPITDAKVCHVSVTV